MPALTNAVQDVPVGPVEVDYRHHQQQGSIGEQLEGDNTSIKQVNVKCAIECSTYSGDKNFHFLGFTHRTNGSWSPPPSTRGQGRDSLKGDVSTAMSPLIFWGQKRDTCCDTWVYCCNILIISGK